MTSYDATDSPLEADAPSDEFLAAFAFWQPILDGDQVDAADVAAAVQTLADHDARDIVALRLHPKVLHDIAKQYLPDYWSLVGLDNTHDNHVSVLGELTQGEWEAPIASTLHTLLALALLDEASDSSDDAHIFFGSATPEVLKELQQAQACDPTATLPALIATTIALTPPVRSGGRD